MKLSSPVLAKHGLGVRKAQVLIANSSSEDQRPCASGPCHTLGNVLLHPPGWTCWLCLRSGTGPDQAQLSCLVTWESFTEKSLQTGSGRRGRPLVLCFCPLCFYKMRYRVCPGCFMPLRFPTSITCHFLLIPLLITFHCSIRWPQNWDTWVTFVIFA